MLSEQTAYSPCLFFLTKQIETEQYENNQTKLVFVGPTHLCLVSGKEDMNKSESSLTEVTGGSTAKFSRGGFTHK